jgi:hypothetical protein
MESKDDRGAGSGLNTGSNEGGERSCSCDAACCGGGGRGGSGRRGIRSVRTLIFIAVVGAAIGVAAWSLLRADEGGNCASGSGCKPGACSADAAKSGCCVGK